MPPVQPVYDWVIYKDCNGDGIPDKVIKRTIGINPPPGTENSIRDEVLYGIDINTEVPLDQGIYLPERLFKIYMGTN